MNPWGGISQICLLEMMPELNLNEKELSKQVGGLRISRQGSRSMRKYGCKKCLGHAGNYKHFDVDEAEIKGREAETRLLIVYLRPDYRMPYILTQGYCAFLKHLPSFSEEN